MKACGLPILPITFIVSQNKVSFSQLLVGWHRPCDLTKCIPQDLHDVLWPMHGRQVLPACITCPNQQSVVCLCAGCICYLAHNTCLPEWRFGTLETVPHWWDMWGSKQDDQNWVQNIHVPQSFSKESPGHLLSPPK